MVNKITFSPEMSTPAVSIFYPIALGFLLVSRNIMLKFFFSTKKIISQYFAIINLYKMSVINNNQGDQNIQDQKFMIPF